MLLYFTNWAILSTYTTSFLGLIISRNLDNNLENAPNLHALHHLMYTLMLFMTPIVVIMYWGVVHEKYMEEIKAENSDPSVISEQINHSYVSHSVPGICAFLLLLISDTVLIQRHCWFLVLFCSIYSFQNYLTVKQKGKPLYWFMTWQDWRSPALCTAITAFFVALFWASAVVD